MQLYMDVTGLDFKTAAKDIDKMLGNTDLKKDIPTPKDNTKILSFIRNNLVELEENDEVQQYLNNRKLTTYDNKHFRKLVNFNYYDDGKVIGSSDCMVACITNDKNERIGYHVTYVKDGKKAGFDSPKKIFGASQGGSIKLGKTDEVLALAEGIETAIAYTQETNITCWASISANNMKSFISPEQVSHLIIVADNDESFTGQEAAYILAKKMKSKGLHVIIEIPDKTGYDYLDMLNI